MVWKRARVVLMAGLLAASVGVGCSRTISDKEKVTRRPDGTVIRDRETVKERPDGTIVVEQEKDVDR